jgi:capsular exopolysaccharide synthesis family protein
MSNNQSLDLTVQGSAHPQPAPYETAGVPAGVLRITPVASNPKAAHYLWLLRRHWWKCLLFAGASMAAAAIISARITPLYESTATVDIDRQMPAGIVGQDSARPGGNDADQFLATQVKVIQSDSVLRKVALRYRLVDAARRDSIPSASGPILQQDTPIVLRNLKVTRPPNTYLLAISYTSPDPQLSADVANAISNAYIDHMHDIQYKSSAGVASFMEKHLEGIKAKMELSSNALAQFERDLNIINPEEKTSILSSRLVQLNAEYTNAEADRVRKEASYIAVKTGSLEAAQVSTQGEALKQLTQQLDEAQQKFTQVGSHFGSNHPEYQKAETQVSVLQKQLQKTRANIAQRVEVEYKQAVAREEMLKATVTRTKGEFDRLNASSFQYQTLKREAEGDRKMYEELTRKIKEAGINAGFQSSAIRVADEARPAFTPVRPNKPLNLSLAFLFSSILSMLAFVVGDALNNSVRDPESLAHTLNTEVVGALPLAKQPQLKSLAVVKANGKGKRATRADGEVYAYDAALRSLRNSILLGSVGRRLRTFMVASPAAAEGKSTIAMNLAIANAQQGYKTLIIDCDLRRPTIHAKAGTDAGRGLPDVLRGDAKWRDVLVRNEKAPGLDMLLGTAAADGDAELVGEAVSGILHEARESYDMIVVDSPPMLGFPEPLHLATQVDGVLMVAHAGHTTRRSLAAALGTLTRLRVRSLGVVLNGVSPDTTEDYSYYNPYGAYQRYYRTRA